MGKKSPGGNSNREAKVAKAGKRSGNTIWPASATAERLTAKEQGEQQFVSQKQLTVERQDTIIVYDKALQAFVYRPKKTVISTEHVYDPTRGRVVYSPSFKEKEGK
jgi:hypothetical protein